MKFIFVLLVFLFGCEESNNPKMDCQSGLVSLGVGPSFSCMIIVDDETDCEKLVVDQHDNWDAFDHDLHFHFCPYQCDECFFDLDAMGIYTDAADRSLIDNPKICYRPTDDIDTANWLLEDCSLSDIISID